MIYKQRNFLFGLWHAGCNCVGVGPNRRLLKSEGAGQSPPTLRRPFSSVLMSSNDELSVLEQHSQTMRLVVASLVASRERLWELPNDARRERLFELQQDAIDAANQSVAIATAALEHFRAIETLSVASS